MAADGNRPPAPESPRRPVPLPRSGSPRSTVRVAVNSTPSSPLRPSAAPYPSPMPPPAETVPALSWPPVLAGVAAVVSVSSAVLLFLKL